jgi:hypothetical protein
LIYPQHPDAIDVVRGGRDYRLRFPQGPTWRVEDDPGVGYLFIVASPEPLDLSRLPYDERYGWDLSGVGEAVYSDPYIAIDDYVAEIVPSWESVPYALDFVTYSIGATYSYPRFLCYDCHTYQRYSSWNPYDYTCSTFRVVIWDDPYYYPRYRYSGVNVVYARPVRALPRYEVTRRVVGDAVAPVVRVRTVAQREAAYKESPLASVPRTATERRTAPVSSGASAPSAASARVRRSNAPVATQSERARALVSPQQVPDTTRARPTLQRRPSARLPVRTPPAARGTQPTPTEPRTTTPAPTRSSPRAPITRPQGEPRGPQATPSRPSTGREPQGSTSPPSARGVPSRPSSQPSTSPRPQAAPQRPQAAPQRMPPSSGRGTARPSTGNGGSGGSRPSASPAPSRPRESPPARSTPPPRSEEPRPTVRPRPTEPARRN